MKITVLTFAVFFILSSSKAQEVLKINGINKTIKYSSHGFNPRIQVGDTLFLLIHTKDKNYDLTLTNAKGKKLTSCEYKSTGASAAPTSSTASANASQKKKEPVTKTLVPVGDDCLKQYSASIK